MKPGREVGNRYNKQASELAVAHILSAVVYREVVYAVRSSLLPGFKIRRLFLHTRGNLWLCPRCFNDHTVSSKLGRYHSVDFGE